MGSRTKIYPTSRRHNLSRFIFVPFNALSLISRVIDEALRNRRISHPKWRNKHTESGFASVISSNARGRFLRITELLPDGRAGSIFIPEGNRSSYGLSSITTFIDYAKNFISLPQSAFNLPLLIIVPETPKIPQKSRPILNRSQSQPAKSHHQQSPAKNRNHGPTDVTL